jgi:hypothetical protein
MTKTVKVSIPHELGRAEARRRIEHGFEKMRTPMFGAMGGAVLNFDERWEQDRLYFQGGALGQKVRGFLDVLDSQVLIEVELPNFLAAIADKVMGKVQQQGQLLLKKDQS